MDRAAPGHAVRPRRGADERDVRAALAELPPDNAWFAAALVVDAAASLLAGNDEHADRQLAEAAASAERLGATNTRVLAIAQRSLLATGAGDNRTAEHLALEARELLAAAPGAASVTSAIVHAAAARAFLWHGRWDDARRELRAADGLAVLP